MSNKIRIAFFTCLFFFISPSFLLLAQNKGLDPVSISKNYYNSIVKILLYDSAAAKISPDLAYIGRGSGFFVSDDGYIFTNRHVIDFCKGYCRYITYNKEEQKEEANIDVYSPSIFADPNLVKITFAGKAAVIVQVYNNNSGSSYNLYYARVIAIDTSNYDGAILKIVSDLKGNPVTGKFHPVPLGNSDSTEQGQDLCLYGFPAQVNGNFDVMLKDMSTLIFGKNSGLDFNINTQYGFIKTDAVINSGNSGGPVFGTMNNVIGIATAAFEKTNVGLISGINGMYDLVSLIPDLKSKLLANGFAIPEHRPAISTAIFFKPSVIPSLKTVNDINNAKTGNKLSRCIQISLGLYGELPKTQTHTIEAFNGTSEINNKYESTSTNGGGTYQMPTSAYGLSMLISSPNVLFKNQDKNLFNFFLKMIFEETTVGWTAPALYTSPYTLSGTKPYPTTLQFNSTVKGSNIFFGFGLEYSHVFNNGVAAGVYYSAGISTADISNQNFGVATCNGQTSNMYYNSSNVIFPQMIGMSFKYKSFFVDISYMYYNESLDYTLPYSYYSNLFYADYFVTGEVKRNPVCLTIGYTYFIYPPRRR